LKKISTAFFLCLAVLVSTFATMSGANAQVAIGVRINTGPHYARPYYRPHYRPGYVWVNGYYRPAPAYYAPSYYAPPSYYQPSYYQPAYYPAPYAGAIWVQGSWSYRGHNRFWNRGHWRHR